MSVGTKDNHKKVVVELSHEITAQIIDKIKQEPAYYIPSEEELEDEESTEAYQIGSVDPQRLEHLPLVFDEETQSYVLLPQGLSSQITIEGTVYSEDEEERFWLETHQKHKCSYCPLKFDTRRGLNRHKFVHRKGMLQKIPCDECGAEFATLSDLSLHLYHTHSRLPQKHQCDDCGLVFPDPQSLLRHFQFGHKKRRAMRGAEECTCKICGMHFERPQLLSYHFKNMHETPKFVCTICGAPCATEVGLTAHYRAHEPKMFTCEVCGASFDTGVLLIEHKRMHSTTYLFACSKCNKSFQRTSLLSAHLRTAHNSTKVTSDQLKLYENGELRQEKWRERVSQDVERIPKRRKRAS